MIPENMQEILGDENRIQQVLINLLSNAIKFSNKEDIFVIAKAYQDKFTRETKLRIEVIDKGLGISKQNQRKLFKTAFTKFDDPDHENPHSAGMGLYICFQIMKALGGSIKVYSAGRGMGTSFIFKVPVTQAPVALDSILPEIKEKAKPVVEIEEMDSSRAMLLPGKKKKKKLPKLDVSLLKHNFKPVKNSHRILVADDVGFSIFAVKFLMNEVFMLDEGVVEYTSDGLQAFEAFKANCSGPSAYSVIILDYNMPYLTGLEVVQAIDGFLRDNPEGKRPYFVIQTSVFDKALKEVCMEN